MHRQICSVGRFVGADFEAPSSCERVYGNQTADAPISDYGSIKTFSPAHDGTRRQAMESFHVTCGGMQSRISSIFLIYQSAEQQRLKKWEGVCVKRAVDKLLNQVARDDLFSLRHLAITFPILKIFLLLESILKRGSHPSIVLASIFLSCQFEFLCRFSIGNHLPEFLL